jgi:hypothetical protein
MMSRLYRVALGSCLLTAVLCLFERPAYAYVDPGTGLVAYQTLSAFLAGALYFFRKRVKMLLRGLRQPDQSR